MIRSFSHIVAMDRNRVIGSENRMPWHLPNDLAWFKKNTMGKPIIMGRKTFESIGKPLPGRDNIVLTRDANFKAEGCFIMRNTDELAQLHHYNLATDATEAMIIGGAEIYRQTLPLVDKLYITKIEAEFAGDTYYPEWDERNWELCESIAGQTDEKNKHPHRFLTYRRVMKGETRYDGS